MGLEVECIIKLGGSAITRKTEFETPHPDNISAAADIMAGMKSKCILIHGAGSFGHFQASEFRLASGYRDLDGTGAATVKTGFCKTRLSVTKLNHLVVEALVNKGIPAVGLSPCGRWRTCGRSKVTVSECERVADLLREGFVPVLHGDGVLDDELGCTVLSGDKITQELCDFFQPRRVVFLSDVDGVYTKPPSDTGAQLIPSISVGQDGTIATSIATSKLQHDVSGGIQGKIASACAIVSRSSVGTPVFICMVGGEASKAACWKGERCSSGGTIIQSVDRY